MSFAGSIWSHRNYCRDTLWHSMYRCWWRLWFQLSILLLWLCKPPLSPCDADFHVLRKHLTYSALVQVHTASKVTQGRNDWRYSSLQKGWHTNRIQERGGSSLWREMHHWHGLCLPLWKLPWRICMSPFHTTSLSYDLLTERTVCWPYKSSSASALYVR
jgi:hypothetical protein